MTVHCPEITTSPRPWGALIVIQNDGLDGELTTSPRPWGALVVVENGGNPTITPSPRPWGALAVVENPTSAIITTSPRPWGALVVVENNGCIDDAYASGAHRTTSPRPWGSLVVVQSDFFDVDDTNRMVDTAWRDLDFTRTSDIAQLLALQAYQSPVFGADHSITTGAHDTRGISAVGGYTTYDNASVDLTADAVDAYTVQTIATTSGNLMLLTTSYRQTAAQGTIIECLPGFQLANGSVGSTQTRRVFRKKETGSATGTARTWRFGGTTFTNYLGSIQTRRPDYTNVVTAGINISKAHYAQAYDAWKRWFETFHRYHDQFNQHLSQIHAEGLGSDAQVTAYQQTLGFGAIGTTARVTVKAHGGRWLSPVASIRSDSAGSSSSCVVARPAFDDTYAYVQFEVVSGGTPTGTTRHDIKPIDLADSTAPTIPTLNTTSPAVTGYVVDSDHWLQIVNNVEALTKVNEREHDPYTGQHKVPLQRFTGATILSGTATVPTAVGDWNATQLEALPGSDRVYFPPAAVGTAGCGIVEFSVAFDDAYTYLIAKRLTAPAAGAATPDVFAYKVGRVDDV